MRVATLIGILLVILGIIGFTYGGITYRRQQNNVNLGPFDVKTEHRETVPVPRVLATISLAGGIALVAVGSWPRRRV